MLTKTPAIKKISSHRQIIEPAGKMKVPVVFHVSDELMPDDYTINQLTEIASDQRVFHHIAALTDVHKKPGRKNPTGTVIATKKYILPQTVDTAPNCGMRMIKTPFTTEDLSAKQIDALFQELVKVVPTKTYFGTPLPHKVIIEISRRGSAALLEHFDKEPTEIENTMLGGNMFDQETVSKKDLFSAIPSFFFRIAQLRLGILGAAGNHFLDLMRIDEILDEETAKKFKLQKGQYIFLMHTGSGMFGQYCSYFYTPKKKEHFSQKAIVGLSRFTFRPPWGKTLQKELIDYENCSEFYGIDEDSKVGHAFMLAHRAAANHGFANRALLQIKLETAIKKVLKKKLTLPLVYDMTHISIQKESHFGKKVWVHRNGTVRANGPQKMKGVKLYEETGEPVFAPSSMSTPAYLGVATDQNESTFFSAAHGTGKAKEKTSAIPTSKDDLFKKVEASGVRLYNAQSRGIINQAAGYYKDIEPGIAGMQANGVMKPVAKMMPVAVLMA